MKNNNKIDTQVVHGGNTNDKYNSIITPIYQSSVFAFDKIDPEHDLFNSENESYCYTRLGNPTVRAFEDAVCKTEGGYRAIATASGMAALNCILFAFTGSGKHIICSESVYGSTHSVIENDWKRFGVEYDFIDTSVPENIENAIKPNTVLIHIETPSNPILQISDIEKAADIAHKNKALLSVDSTFAGPVFQNPLKQNADMVFHSVTKYINGHSDVVGGIVIAKNKAIYDKLHHAMVYSGGNMDPHQAFLAHRGFKTIALRMRKAQENAMQIANYLTKHPKVDKVFYPGLKTSPNHEVALRQMTGFSSVLAFEITGGTQSGVALMNALKLIAPAVSLGGIESFIQHPASMTHSNVAPADRLKSGISDGLVRMAVGIEDADDLLNDLEQALKAV